MSALGLASFAVAGSIPPDQVDSSQVYRGNAASFENAAEVDTNAAVQATPEYEEIRRDKIDSGTARYWILVSQATDRVIRAISEAGSDSGYDLIAEKGYLGSLDPPVDCDDITDDVIKRVAK